MMTKFDYLFSIKVNGDDDLSELGDSLDGFLDDLKEVIPGYAGELYEDGEDRSWIYTKSFYLNVVRNNKEVTEDFDRVTRALALLDISIGTLVQDFYLSKLESRDSSEDLAEDSTEYFLAIQKAISPLVFSKDLELLGELNKELEKMVAPFVDLSPRQYEIFFRLREIVYHRSYFGMFLDLESVAADLNAEHVETFINCGTGAVLVALPDEEDEEF